jgi:hypothetical protein
MHYKLSALAARFGIGWGRLFYIRQPRVAASAAQAAVQDLLSKQQADLDSFIIRTALHLGVLEKARQSVGDKPQLEATTNMVKAFLASAFIFRNKWSGQVAMLNLQYPLLHEMQAKSGLRQLELFPQGLCPSEELLRQALKVA